MKLHLETTVNTNYGKMIGLSCTSNLHAKGRTLTRDEFIQAIQDGKDVCSKCAKKI